MSRLSDGAIVDDRLARQPFDDRRFRRAQDKGVLGRGRSRRCDTTLGRPGCRQLRMRAASCDGIDDQRIAADDPSGRMDDDVLADAVALGVERFLHPQRPDVHPLGEDGARAGTLEAQAQFGAPAR